MDPTSVDLGKRAARLAVPYAAIFAVVYFVIDLLSKIPIIGLLFFCLNGLASLAVYFAIAYFITPKLNVLATPQNRASQAFPVGVGVSVVTTAIALIAVLISGILGVIVGSALAGSDSAFGSAAVGGFGLILRLVGFGFFGLIVGTLLAFLGSFVALGRGTSVAGATRPF